MVNIGRLSTVILMIASAVVALSLTNAKQLFDILLMFGAGTGLVYILRWFWWRINAWSEISVMFAAAIVSLIFTFTSLGDFLFGYIDRNGWVIEGVFPSWARFLAIVLVTTIVWIVATFITKPEDKDILISFYKKTQPGGAGWKKVVEQASKNKINIVDDNDKKWAVPSGVLAMVLGCIFVYSTMFATGNWIYGEYPLAIGLTVLVAVSGFLLSKVWRRMKDNFF